MSNAANIIGKVEVADDGAITGSGVARRLFDLMIAVPSMAGSTSVQAHRQIAEVCNTLATMWQAPRLVPTGIKSANYTADYWDFVECDAGVTLLLLPAANAASNGYEIGVRNVELTGTLTIAVVSSGVVDGGSIYLLGALKGTRFISDGTQWKSMI